MTLQTLGGRIYSRVREMTRLPPEAWRSLRPSFSQYGEDHAVLKLLRPQGSGTFVDVGANDPLESSNTALLYALGWNGLAIEPNPDFAAKFKKCRPRDICLTMGVAEQPSHLTYYQFQYSEMNTFSKDRAEQLISEGTIPVSQREVSCRPLHEIVDEYLPGRHVDLLNIDCEGLDLEVLRSARLEEMRPTVLIVEDYNRYVSFRDGHAQGGLDEFMRSAEYSPICQMAWSTIYVSNKWRDAPSGAFRFQGVTGYLP